MNNNYVKNIDLSSQLDNVSGTLLGWLKLDQSNLHESGDIPKKIGLGAICICLRGEGNFTLDGNDKKISRGDMVIAFPNSIIQNAASTSDFLGYTIIVKTEKLTNLKTHSVIQSYVSVRENPIIPLTDEQMSMIIELCEMLKEKDRHTDNPFHDEINEAMLSVISYEIHAILLQQHPAIHSASSRQEVIVQDFLSSIEKNYKEHRDIGFYAGELCITPKYLSVVVKNISGISPVEWINRTVLLSAKTMLTTTDLTVQQIASELNFPNPSFFGQYFKRSMGVTPKKFRSKAKA